MTVKVVVSGIIIVMLIAVIVFAIEFFIPLSAKSDMNIYCRNVLIKMEVDGGLSSKEKDKLLRQLSDSGFSNIHIDGTVQAKQGEEMCLYVEADYIYNKMTVFLIRSNITQRMVYDKTVVARRVVN